MRNSNTIPENNFYLPEADAEQFPILYLPNKGMKPYAGPPRNDIHGDFHWAIIGGGIQGSYIANILIHSGHVDPSRIAIFDPHDRLLDFWKTASGNTGMTHLRSGSVHHLDYYPVSLRHFYASHREKYPNPYVPKYNRPSIELFNDHCDWVIGRENLEDFHIRERIDHFEFTGDMWRLSSSGIDRKWTSANVILAIGLSEQPVIPAWAGKLIQAGEKCISHLFAEGFNIRSPFAESKHTLIVGAGISALQAALFIRRNNSNMRISIVAEHPITAFDFDSDPGFIGPRKLAVFAEEEDPVQRRANINSVRYPGTGDPALVREITDVINDGGIEHLQGSVSGALSRSKDMIADISTADGEGISGIEVDRIILATGFHSRRPGGKVVDELITRYKLPIGQCGYPIPDMSLRWSEGLYVTGPLGELEIGPVARNIAGAKRAGERLVAAIQGRF